MPQSKKPKKQRKQLYQKKQHERSKVFSAHLNQSLRKQYGIRAIPLRKGDTVKVMSGDNKGKQGKVVRFGHIKNQVFIEKVTRKKSDGTEILIPFKASNLLVIDLETKDNKRFKNMSKKPKTETKKEEKGE